MKKFLTKAASLFVLACFIISTCVCTTALAAEQIASKSLKFFDEETWTDCTLNKGMERTFTLPVGIESLVANNVTNTYATTKASGVFGKADEDSSFKFVASGRVSSNRYIYADLAKSSDTSTNIQNLAKGDIYTLYVDLAVPSVGGTTAASHGIRITGRKAAGATTVQEYYPIIFKTEEVTDTETGTTTSKPIISVYDGGDRASVDYTLSTWVSVAIEIEAISDTQVQFTTYINGEKVGTSGGRSLVGITYVQAGMQWSTSTHSANPELHVDNFEFVAGSGYDAAKYSEIKAAKERHIEVGTLAKDEKVKFYAYVDNAEAATKDVTAFAAVYDNSGKLIDVAKSDKQLAASTTGQGAGVTLTLSKEAADYENAKVAGFIWEKGTLVPIGGGCWYTAQ